MANVGVGELSTAIPTIIAAEALGYLKANTVFAQLVSRDWDNDIAQYGDTVSVQFLGALSVNDKATDTAVTLQTPSTSGISVVLDKHKEVSFLIEDIGKALARPDVLSGYISDALKVVAEQIDSDIAGLYSGLSQTIDATAGMAEDDFRNARMKLNAAKAPLGDRSFVMSEDGEYELLGIDRFVNRDYEQLGSGPAGLISAYAGRFMGFNVFMDQKTVFSTDWKNIAFHRDAFVLASRPLPPAPAGAGVLQTVMDEDGMGLRVTISYNPDHLGVQVTVDVLYGVKELRDTFGVLVTTAAVP